MKFQGFRVSRFQSEQHWEARIDFAIALTGKPWNLPTLKPCNLETLKL
jgi:hypothetical protein